VYFNSGTSEKGLNENSLWVIQEARDASGYYTISNYAHESFRLARWSNNIYTTGVYNGNYNDW